MNLEEQEKTEFITAQAAVLVKATAESTANALNIQYIQKDIVEIKQAVKDLLMKDAQYVLKENFFPEKFAMKDEFNFWRNLLVSGLLLSIAIGVIFSFLKK